MKTKLLRKLRAEHQIVSTNVDIIKELYSVTPYNKYRGDDPQDAYWCSFGYNRAKEKQRELILESLKRYKCILS